MSRYSTRCDGVLRSVIPWLAGAVLVFLIVLGVFSGGDQSLPDAAAGSSSDGTLDISDVAGSESVVASAEAKLVTEVWSVGDAVLHDGAWFLVDGEARRVHVVDTGSMAMRTSFGAVGEGPGEFAGRPSAIAIQEGLIVVADPRRLQYFRPSGEYVDDRLLSRSAPGCLTRLISGMVAMTDKVVVAERCPSVSGEGGARAVTEAGTVLASLYYGDAATIDIEANLVLADHPQGFVFGSTGDDCLGLYGPDGEEIERLCHGWMQRVPVPRWYVDTLEAVARRRRLDVDFRTESLPRFTRVFSVSDGRLAYARPMGSGDPDSSLDGPLGTLRLVAYDGDGGERALPLPAAPIAFASGGSALLAWPEMKGTRILIANFPEDGW